VETVRAGDLSSVVVLHQLGTVEALFLVLDFLQMVALVLFVLREAVELAALE
jgi:hypothetical protein